eukprot:TRINITY_DN4827_c0_g1_i5.p1 TRINITY_DN4827_c0_g1~~TRINITY_DN4827_c0_g1_i5.p1  ORF type:complete len:522 (+),score=117.36 TRINITY_DN4827_c0_g1_i5:3-1568(+)
MLNPSSALNLIHLRCTVDINWQALCKVHLTVKEIKEFQEAIAKKYYFQMLYDDLPLWGFIGEMVKDGVDHEGKDVYRYYLNTHLHFSLSYNKDQVIHINVSSDPRQREDITDMDETTITFSYSAKWKKTDIKFVDRMDRYSKNSFFPRELEIHWMSIMNSLVLVVLLTGFLAIIILRILKNDYMRYNKEDDEEDGESADDYGWKLIHADVFRFPDNKLVFCAFVGSGAQLFTLAMFILLLAVVGVFYPHNRGALYTASIVLYALTAGVGGFFSSKYYIQMGGKHWAWNVLLSGTLFPIPFFITAAILNTIAIVYGTTSALPFGTIVVVLLIYTLVGLPLTVLGGISGRSYASNHGFDAPCRTKAIRRQIPPIPWYRSTQVQMLMAGFLPFSAIYIELYYIFSSIWGHKTYTLYGILMLSFLILLVVTACITIALTYLQLAMEDHEWWWRSFLSAGSTAILIYAYAIFFFNNRSEMSGTLQSSFYFGYMLMICYGFFIMLGTIGWFSSLVFIKRIFSVLKAD